MSSLPEYRVEKKLGGFLPNQQTVYGEPIFYEDAARPITLADLRVLEERIIQRLSKKEESQ